MSLQLAVIAAHDLSSSERQAILDICTEAYGKDFTAILAQLSDAIHLLARSEALVATPDERVMILRTAKTPLLDISTMITAEWREGDLW